MKENENTWLQKIGLQEAADLIEMTDIPLVFPYEVYMSDLLRKDKDVHSI